MVTEVMVEQCRSAAARRAPTGWPHRIHPALAKRMVTVSPGPARVTVAPLETAAMHVSPGMRRTVPVVLRCSRSAGLIIQFQTPEGYGRSRRRACTGSYRTV